ncbi:MAG: ABC transporter ATP-binding protein [Eubacteriales bacterium]
MLSKRNGLFQDFIKLIDPYKSKYVKSVILSLISVTGGFVTYIIAAHIIIELLNGNSDPLFYIKLCGVTAICFVIKCVFSALSTSASHEATFCVMSEVRRLLCEKFSKLPMGYVLETPSGKLKSKVVERVEQLEIPLSHAIPEMTANILLPLGIAVYLFILDWRIAISVLVVFAATLLCYMFMMKTYPKHYGEVILAGKHMNATTVEYINGIKVIKTFAQESNSYDKFENAVNDNTSSILRWMKSTQIYSSVMMNLLPSVLLTVLPVGLLTFITGGISIPEFVICILLSLAMTEPLAAAVFLTDEMAKIGTVTREIWEVLDKEEMIRPTDEKVIEHYNISLENVSFAYEETTVLNKINLEAKEGQLTALVGSSGGGKSTAIKLASRFWDIQWKNHTWW